MKKLSAYLKNREDNIYIQIGRARSKYTPSTFHILRVEIKKLQAEFDLINFCYKDFSKKDNFKPFKLLFKRAGKIREIQLEENMLKNYFRPNTMKNYRQALKKEMLDEKNKFFLMVNKKLIEQMEKIYKNTYSAIKNVHSKKAEKFFHKKVNGIRKNLNRKNISPVHLHKIRKQLKELYYIQKCMGIKYKFVFLKSLQKLLGKWHDGQVLKLHIAKSIKRKKINSFELKHLRKIQLKVNYETNLLYINIRKQIHSPRLQLEFSENIN
jgi:hypothetical protein